MRLMPRTSNKPSHGFKPFEIYAECCTPRLRKELMRRLKGLTLRIKSNYPSFEPLLVWDIADEKKKTNGRPKHS